MRQIAVLGTLLGLALAGSYVAWTDEGTDRSGTDQVAVYRATVDDLEQITWRTDSLTAVLERRSDAKGSYVWITLTETIEPEAPEPVDTAADTDAVEAPAASPPAPETHTVSFKGNQAADQLWEAFAPLYALRELQTEGPNTDAAFGFSSPTGTLEIVRESGPLTLVLGGETYGVKHRYAQLDDRVLLLEDKTLRPLQYAGTRLVDRMLHPIAEQAADRVDVSFEGRQVAFVHKNKDDRARSFWARADDDATEDAAGATWVGKLMRLRVQDYDVPDDPSALEPVFAFTVTEGRTSWAVEVLRADDTQFYARTDYARGLVHLTESLALEAVADLDTVFPAR